MKKLLSLSLVIAVLLAGLFVFTGCEKDEEKEDKKETDLSAVAGTYMGQYTKLVGDDEKNKDEEFYLELDKDGTGKHHRDDSTFKVEWSLDGTDFKMTEKFIGDPIEYTGTLKDGKLDIFNGDPDDDWTYEYVYEKDDSKTSKDDKDDKDDDDKKDNKISPFSKNDTLVASKAQSDSTMGKYEERVEISFDNNKAKTVKFILEFEDDKNIESIAELLKTSMEETEGVSVDTKGNSIIATMDIEAFADMEGIDDEDLTREALEEVLKEDVYTIKSGASTTTTTKTDDNKTTTGIDKKEDTDKKDDTKTTTTPSTTTTTGLRPDFKKTMDDYEDFIDQYVEIMRKYKESNGKDTSILSDYTSYMNKYTELSKNLQKYNASTMNSEELAYYMEVVQRCSEKMKNAGN